MIRVPALPSRGKEHKKRAEELYWKPVHKIQKVVRRTSGPTEWYGGEREKNIGGRDKDFTRHQEKFILRREWMPLRKRTDREGGGLERFKKGVQAPAWQRDDL